MVLLGFRVAFLALAAVSGPAAQDFQAAARVRASVEPIQRAADSPELSAALSRAFPEADAITARVASLSVAQRTSLATRLRGREAPRLWTYREAHMRGELVGRAIVDDVIGKSLPITYLVTLSADSRVRAVEILNYRESHGGEVRREKWRSQFKGLAVGDAIKLGTQIKNIAGATLSCRALTDGVHDALAIADVVFAAPVDSKLTASSVPAARYAGEANSEVLRRTQLLMGTLLDVRAVTTDRAQFDAAADAAFARVAELESMWSMWKSDSEVSCLNAAEPGVWSPLSPATVALLSRAAGFRLASGDAFAVEIGPLVEVWQTAERLQREPTSAEIELARAACTREAFEVDGDQLRARRRLSAARLDLGAIGKGAALDEVAREFRSRGLSRALFDFGGQFLALAGPRAGAGWPLVVRDPRPDAERTLWELELESASLATSADDQRGLRVDGRRRSHIVDPRSGLPARALWTACALAPDATTADAWSTATFVLGEEAAGELAAKHAVRVLGLDLQGVLFGSADFPGHRSSP